MPGCQLLALASQLLATKRPESSKIRPPFATTLRNIQYSRLWRSQQTPNGNIHGANTHGTSIVRPSEGHIALLLDSFEVVPGDKLIAQVTNSPAKAETILGGLGAALAELHQIDFTAAEEKGCDPLRDIRCGFLCRTQETF